ncbi:MAG: hypothetical protein JNL74_12090 [Fibrobacteres bacterium]|nr:hypothetical protein [Fibrobacterota bacterium]
MVFIAFLCFIVNVYSETDERIKRDSLVSNGEIRAAIPYAKAAMAKYGLRAEDRHVLARLLSWTNQLEASLLQYDTLLSEQPNDTLVRLEKARILGWMGRHTESITEYKTCCLSDSETPNFFEYKFKDALWKGKITKAMQYLSRLVVMSPEQTSHLFDQGQLFAGFGKNTEALNVFGKILEKEPKNLNSLYAFNAVQKRQKGYTVELTTQYWQARSLERMVDVAYLNSSIYGKKNVTDNIQLNLNYALNHFGFNSINKLDHDFSLSASYANIPEVSFTTNLTLNTKENGASMLLGSVYGSQRILDMIQIEEMVARRRLYTNKNLYDFNANEYVAQARIKFLINRFLDGSLFCQYSDIYDGNSSITTQAATSVTVLPYPRLAQLVFAVENWHYDKVATEYFSPQQYRFASIIARHHKSFSPEGLFLGARQFVLKVEMEEIVDNNKEFTHRPFIAFKADLRGRMYAEIASRLTSSKYYDDLSINFNLGGIF